MSAILDFYDVCEFETFNCAKCETYRTYLKEYLDLEKTLRLNIWLFGFAQLKTITHCDCDGGGCPGDIKVVMVAPPVVSLGLQVNMFLVPL